MYEQNPSLFHHEGTNLVTQKNPCSNPMNKIEIDSIHVQLCMSFARKRPVKLRWWFKILRHDSDANIWHLTQGCKYYQEGDCHTYLKHQLDTDRVHSTTHKWQNWKSTLLTCLRHNMYRLEAVGQKSSNYNT